jgi:Peptidase family M48
MPRNVIIGLSAVFYVALSVWLVGKQGQAYREGLRSDRSAVAPLAKSEQPQPSPTSNATAPGISENTAAKTQATPAVAAVSEQPNGKAADHQASSRPHLKDRPKPKHVPSTVADAGQSRAPVKESNSTDPLAADPFWNGPEMLRNWDIANLSVSDEQKLGAQLHDVIVSLNPVAADGPWRQRLEEAAKPFRPTLTRKDVRYHFEVMESAEVNAFSHPGGYVYVNRGLFDLVGEDEDYALQFAVGNEMAHVDLQHAIRCLQDPDFKTMTGGTIRKLYWVILPLGYMENQDYAADEWTFTRMRSFGRSKREALAFLYKLDGYATKHGFRDGRAKSRMAPEESSFLDIHYRRQTAAWKRLEHLKELIK